MAMLTDHCGRKIQYLRISVTDRCNLRCVYCMPPEGVRLIPHDAIMRYEEIARVAQVAAEQGVTRIRLTGGDPLARRGLADLIAMLAAIPQIEDISLTTNGLLLERMAAELKDAGLRRVNISLDTLDEAKFARITRGGSLQAVLRGVEAAEAAGLRPVKINAVAMRGVNDGELLDLARLTLARAWHVRFIELMPFSTQSCWGDGFPPPEETFLPVSEIFERLAPLGLVPAGGGEDRNGPARLFQVPGAKGKIGLISPVSQHFCAECNRMRLTADGSFRPCLLWDREVPFLKQMRAGEDILPLLLRAVNEKPAGHALTGNSPPEGRGMRQIGG